MNCGCLQGKVSDVTVYIPSGHPEFAVLSASVKPSQRSNDDAHKCWILCKDNGEVKTAHCTCIAGFGEVCSHVFAILYRIQLAVSMQLTNAPTEKRCEWNSSFSSKVPCSTLKDVTLEKTNWNPNLKRRRIEVNSPSTVSPITPEEFANLKLISPQSVVFAAFVDSSDTDTASDSDECDDIPPTIAEIISKHQINEVDSLLPFFDTESLKTLELKTRNQRNKLWFEHRRGRITASNFGEILRRKQVSPLFLNKFTTISAEINAPSVRWGRLNEVKGFKSYQDSEKVKHTNFSLRRAGLFISSTDPYLGCSPDGIVNCDCCGSGVLEIKCPYKYKNVDPRIIATTDNKFCLNSQGFLKEDHPYYAQIQRSSL